jgi:hypothetical protein
LQRNTSCCSATLGRPFAFGVGRTGASTLHVSGYHLFPLNTLVDLVVGTSGRFDRREVFSKIWNQRLNGYLKEMADVCSITKSNLSSCPSQARHYIKKALPKEVLIAIANLNHVAAKMNRIAKKRNSFAELSAIERAEIQATVGKLKQFVKDFK